MNLHEYAQYLAMEGEAEPSVTVEPLEVTENGEYIEEGKAYSPVTVNVPNASALEMTELNVVNNTNGSIMFRGFEIKTSNNETALLNKVTNISANSSAKVHVPRYNATYAISRPLALTLYSVLMAKSASVTMTMSEGTVKYGRVAELDTTGNYAFAIQLTVANPTASVTLTIA